MTIQSRRIYILGNAYFIMRQYPVHNTSAYDIKRTLIYRDRSVYELRTYYFVNVCTSVRCNKCMMNRRNYNLESPQRDIKKSVGPSHVYNIYATDIF